MAFDIKIGPAVLDEVKRKIRQKTAVPRDYADELLGSPSQETEAFDPETMSSTTLMRPDTTLLDTSDNTGSDPVGSILLDKMIEDQSGLMDREAAVDDSRYSAPTEDEIREAMRRANRANLIPSLIETGSNNAAIMAGVRPNPEQFRDWHDQANLPLTMIMQRKKMAEEGFGDDPDSPKSRAYRAVLANMGVPLDSIRGLSANQMQEMGLLNQAAVDRRSQNQLDAQRDMALVNDANELEKVRLKGDMDMAKLREKIKARAGRGSGKPKLVLTDEEALELARGNPLRARMIKSNPRLGEQAALADIKGENTIENRSKPEDPFVVDKGTESRIKDWRKNRDLIDNAFQSLAKLKGVVPSKGSIPGAGIIESRIPAGVYAAGEDFLNVGGEGRKVKQAADQVLAEYGKLISGANIPESEKELFKNIIGSMSSEEGLRDGIRLLEAKRDRLEQNMDQAYGDLYPIIQKRGERGKLFREGKSLDTSSAGSPSQTIPVIDKTTGKKGSIPADRIDAALKSGRFERL